MSDHLATVTANYEAFSRGDIPAILETVADDVSWEQWTDNSAQKAGVPWLLPRSGKANVPGFFEAVSRMQFHEFRVLSLLSGGNQVAATLFVDVTFEGRRMQDEEMHLWTFDAAGKVVGFRHYCDTAKHIAGAGL